MAIRACFPHELKILFRISFTTHHFVLSFSVFTLCTLQEVMIPRNFSHVTFLCLVFVSTYLNVLAAENTENQDGERLKRSYGKRITPHLVAELGKRPKELYSFGIGKK